MSSRRLRRAIHGIALGLTASLVLVSGVIIILRFGSAMYLGDRAPYAVAVFVVIFVWIAYRLWRDF